MKCPICHGKGRIQDHKYNEEHDIEYLVYCEKKCEYCNGTGEVEQTNEEYMQTCNTEQLAEALLNIIANNEFTLYLLHTEKKSVQDIKGAVVEWLKQPHTVKE